MITERKKKKPPTFQYLPKNRAKRLKKSWIEDHKIRSKWKAQKRREGLANRTDTSAESASSRAHDETNMINAESESGTSPDRPAASPVLKPSHDKQSLRDLRRIAYAPNPTSTQKSDPPGPKSLSKPSRDSRCGKAAMQCETGQPNMKLRMNVLLEKIKRDLP